MQPNQGSMRTGKQLQAPSNAPLPPKSHPSEHSQLSAPTPHPIPTCAPTNAHLAIAHEVGDDQLHEAAHHQAPQLLCLELPACTQHIRAGRCLARHQCKHARHQREGVCSCTQAPVRVCGCVLLEDTHLPQERCDFSQTVRCDAEQQSAMALEGLVR